MAIMFQVNLLCQIMPYLNHFQSDLQNTYNLYQLQLQ